MSKAVSKLQAVFETGAFGEANWQDAQELPNNWYVKNDAIESFGLLK